jgi:hypothetical protein
VPFAAETEGGESGDSHFVGTTCGLPSNANPATDLLDFEADVDVSSRRRVSLIRSSKFPFPLFVMRTSLRLPWSV